MIEARLFSSMLSGLFFLSIKELSLKLGLPERTVSTWAEKQLLCPSIEDATGCGSMRIWSENDFRQGELLVRLMPILRPELIREIAKQFKN